jgi:hypothetical protein
MAEAIVYYLLGFAVLAGLCLLCGIIATEYLSWKYRRRVRTEKMLPAAAIHRERRTAPESQKSTVRGYDNGDLFR